MIPVRALGICTSLLTALLVPGIGATGCRCPSSSTGHLLAGSGAERPGGFLKGQLHAHTSGSGDCQTPPAVVARFYAARGYDFVVLTDHNRITTFPVSGPLLVLPGVELTFNLTACSPPEPGHPCLLHANVLPVASTDLPGLGGLRTRPPTRREVYGQALELARSLGGLAMVNHPNFHYAAGAPLLRDLADRGLVLLEVANQSIDANNEGDADHPGTEALWDAVLSAGRILRGVASDDAHHYEAAEMAAARQRGELVYPGDRGFVMVRARREAGAIREALARGDFYSSTGVILGRVEVAEGVLHLEVDRASPGEHHFVFIGRGGKVLAEARGRRARFPLAAAAGGGKSGGGKSGGSKSGGGKSGGSKSGGGKSGGGKGHGPGRAYVRAIVRDHAGRRAWVQPVWVP